MFALYPLYSPKDDLSDIPLTPSQRTLLGLDASSSTPITPGTQYITPPRYRLSSSSQKGSPISPASSPLSGKGSNSSGKIAEPSPLSPSFSPLFQKAVGSGTREGVRRQSFGSSSSFGRSALRDSSVLRSPSTPSPTTGKNSNMVLTNKWLYDKSRVMSSSNGSFR